MKDSHQKVWLSPTVSLEETASQCVLHEYFTVLAFIIAGFCLTEQRGTSQRTPAQVRRRCYRGALTSDLVRPGPISFALLP